MLNNIIGISFILVFTYYFFIDFHKSIKFLFITMLVAPNFILGDLIVPYYILSFIVLLFLGIIFRFKSLLVLHLDKVDICLVIIFLYDIINSLIHLMMGFYDEYSYLSLFSYIRFIVLFLILKHMKKESFDDYIFPVLVINIIVSIYQLIIPNSIDIMYQFYGKPSYTVLQKYMDLGYTDRPTGTLLSPVILGAFSLLCFSYYVSAKNVSKSVFKIICSVVLGIFALSKTAILGIPFIFLLTLLSKKINKKIIFSSVGLILFFLVVGTIYSYYNEDKWVQLMYYLDFLTKPLDALNTRYGDTGNVEYFYTLVKNNIIFGMGSTQIGNINIVDSLYVGTIAEGGLILLIAYIFWLWRTSYNYLVFLAILLSGVGGSYYFSILLLPFICCVNKHTREACINVEVKKC